MQDSFRSRADIQGKVESHIYSLLRRDTYALRELPPSELITSNRLDIILCYLYLQLYKANPAYANLLYSADISAHTFGRMIDHDNASKQTLEDFKTAYHLLVYSLDKHGYNPEIALLPLAADQSLLNGGHRLSAALHLKIPVTTILTEIPPLRCNYQFLINRNVPHYMVEHCISEYIKLKPGYRLTISRSEPVTIQKKSGIDILYKKKIVVTPQLRINLSNLLKLSAAKSTENSALRLSKYLSNYDATTKVSLSLVIWKDIHTSINYNRSNRGILSDTLSFTEESQNMLEYLSNILVNDAALHFLSTASNDAINATTKYVKHLEDNSDSQQHLALVFDQQLCNIRTENTLLDYRQLPSGENYRFAILGKNCNAINPVYLDKCISMICDASKSFRLGNVSIVLAQPRKQKTYSRKDFNRLVSFTHNPNMFLSLLQWFMSKNFLLRKRIGAIYVAIKNYIKK